MKKTFDCVKMMRDIRTKLSRRYISHPELLECDLGEIRKKYGFPEPQPTPRAKRVAEMKAECGSGKPKGN
jgi:hypothetical protein